MIVALQETWLYEDGNRFLSKIHEKFNGVGVSAVNSTNKLVSGRPHGGIAFLWKKDLDVSVEVVQYDDSRIMGLKMKGEHFSMLFVNVYLPFECDENAPEYSHCLGKIMSNLEESTESYAYVLGDFNADPSKGKFWDEVMEYSAEVGLVASDVEFFKGPNQHVVYTYVSESHHTTSWLDHCLCTPLSHAIIRRYDILTKYAVSDHIPLSLELDCDICVKTLNNEKGFGGKKVNWSNVSDDDIQTYGELADSLLGQIVCNYETLTCNDTSCNDPLHRDQIDKLYCDISQALCTASDKTLCRDGKDSKSYVVPGWNEFVKEAHSQARETLLLWASMGTVLRGL